ncbi:MAG: hypothetical protein MUC72_08675 [Acidobacteria bacterium]|nr:hypothetical protein [Acidobacteriota bacterium]
MIGGKNKSIILSYMSLRNLIGVLGIMLPLICILGGIIFSGLPCQHSISFYYHTNMRDFFIGILLVVSVFLITYKGYRTIDNIVTWVIGIAGIAVAFFPVPGPGGDSLPVGLLQTSPLLSNMIHVSAAAVFFILLALNSLFLFTLSRHKMIPPGSKKCKRNRIYVTCGVIILASLAMFVILYLTLGSERFEKGNVVLVLESVMLGAFGVSWLTKGEMLCRDEKK